MWRKESTRALLVGLQTSTTPMENGMEIPHKQKIGIPYDLTILPLRIYSKKMRMLI